MIFATFNSWFTWRNISIFSSRRKFGMRNETKFLFYFGFYWCRPGITYIHHFEPLKNIFYSFNCTNNLTYEFGIGWIYRELKIYIVFNRSINDIHTLNISILKYNLRLVVEWVVWVVKYLLKVMRHFNKAIRYGNLSAKSPSNFLLFELWQKQA